MGPENFRTSFETAFGSVELDVFTTIDNHEWKKSFIECLSDFLHARKKPTAQLTSTLFSDRLVEIIVDAAICDYDEDVCLQAFALSVGLIDYVGASSPSPL